MFKPHFILRYCAGLFIALSSVVASAASFTPAGSLNSPRTEHTATLLSNGRVLVSGGVGITGNELKSTETYDPAIDTWIRSGDLLAARTFHTATLLVSGRVLVAGGRGISGNALNSSEIFDPATNSWTTTGPMK